MSELNVEENDTSVDEFLASVEDPARRKDTHALRAMMKEVNCEPPACGAPKLLALEPPLYLCQRACRRVDENWVFTRQVETASLSDVRLDWAGKLVAKAAKS